MAGREGQGVAGQGGVGWAGLVWTGLGSRVVWLVPTTFLKTNRLAPLSDAFFNVDHDDLIKIDIFSKNGILTRICDQK